MSDADSRNGPKAHPDHSTSPARRPITPISPLKTVVSSDDQVVCERCGGGMYRMHAVWRCAQCGYKTDCCGW